MKKIIPPILALVCTIIFFSCGKETQSSTQGGGVFKIKFTFSPPLPNGITGTAPYTGSSGLSFIIQGMQVYNWNGKDATSSLTTYESNEFSVTKGQNIIVNQLTVGNFDKVCRTVKCEGLLNGKTTQVFTKELGNKDLNVGGVGWIQCKDNGGGLNFIIP